MTSFSDFKQHVSDVFLFEVDNIQRSAASTGLARPAFWSDLYEQRLKANGAFDAFLRSSGSDVLCVTGRVGTGKSTFLRNKFEHAPRCSGIFMDMQCYADECPTSCTVESAESFFFGALMFQIKEALTVSYIALNAKAVESFADVTSLSHELTPALGAAVTYGPEYRDPAEFQIAIDALMWLTHSDHPVAKIRRGMGVKRPSAAEYRKAYQAILEGEPTLATQIVDQIDWASWLFLYRVLVEPEKTKVICFDNLDKLNLQGIQDHFLEIPIVIIDRCQRERVKLGGVLPPLKIVFAIRDENVTRLRLPGGGTQRITQVRLEKHNVAIGVPSNQSHCCETSMTFATAVIKRRLEHCPKASDSTRKMAQFVDIVRNTWLHGTEGAADGPAIQQIGRLSLFALSNETLRTYLLMVSQTTLEIMEQIENGWRAVYHGTSAIETSTLKGHIMRWFLRSNSTAEMLAGFKAGLALERDTNVFCAVRAVLTYLAALRKDIDDWRPTCRRVVERMSDGLSISEEDVRGALFVLYRSRVRDGEFVTIYANSEISSPEGIDLGWRVACNPQGREFIQNISIQFEFFSELLGERRSLAEMHPSEASEHISNVYEAAVGNVKNNSISAWLHRYLPRVPRRKLVPPFVTFSSEFMVQRGFHIKRTADSHRGSIKRYVIDVLDKSGPRLLLPPPRIQELAGRYEDFRLPTHLRDDNLPDYVVEDVISRLPANDPLVAVWTTYNSYRADLGELVAVEQAMDEDAVALARRYPDLSGSR